MSTTSVVDVDEVTKRLNVAQLRERAQAAVAEGRLTQAAVDAAEDHDEGEKFQLRRLVLEAAIGPDRMAALRAMKVKALKALAAEVGGDAARIEETVDARCAHTLCMNFREKKFHLNFGPFPKKTETVIIWRPLCPLLECPEILL